MNIFGLDIGGTRIKAGAVSTQGKVVVSRAIPTPSDLEKFRFAIAEIFGQLILAGCSVPERVGIGCKGVINSQTTEVEILPGPLQFLEGQRLSSIVESIMQIESSAVFADNDARVALAGEVVWGAARGRKNVVMLTLGTGVGGGVLSDGRILRGERGAAGHLGHITIDPDGLICLCGNRGCLETVFSARAIEAEALHAIHRGCESILTDKFANNISELTCQDVYECAASGDALSQSIIDHATRNLGAGLAGLLHVFDPEIVILGGQISEAEAVLFGPVQAEIAWRTKRLLGREVPVVQPQVEDRSGVVGAAALALMPCMAELDFR